MPLRISRALPRQRHRPQRAKHLVYDHTSPKRFATSQSFSLSNDVAIMASAPLCLSPLSSAGLSRASLRHALRQRRRTLTFAARQQAAIGMRHLLLSLNIMKRARRIALYLPDDGELDPIVLLTAFEARGIDVYVPVLKPAVTHSLWFVRLRPDTRLVRNRYGLLEPMLPRHASRADRCAPWAIDVVLMPLVGFDANGARLGMGGGFYDRTFAWTRKNSGTGKAIGKRPRLIGVAHDVQEVDCLPTETWDVPLDLIVTGTRCLVPDTKVPTLAKAGTVFDNESV